MPIGVLSSYPLFAPFSPPFYHNDNVYTKISLSISLTYINHPNKKTLQLSNLNKEKKRKRKRDSMTLMTLMTLVF